MRGDIQDVVNRLKSRAGMTERIPGYPFIFVVDPKRKVTTPISLAGMEHNMPEQKIYTHHPELVKSAIFFALGMDLDQRSKDYMFSSEAYSCENYLMPLIQFSMVSISSSGS